MNKIEEKFVQLLEVTTKAVKSLHIDDVESAEKLMNEREQMIELLKSNNISFAECSENVKSEIMKSNDEISKLLSKGIEETKENIKKQAFKTKASNFYNYQRNDYKKFDKKV